MLIHLDDEHVWERVDLHWLGVTVDAVEACEGVTAVDVHGTGTTDALTAGAPSNGEIQRDSESPSGIKAMAISLFSLF